MKSAGFTIVEVIVAFGLVLVGLLGAFALLQSSQKSTFSLKNELIAAHLAQEGVEGVRAIRDSNFIRRIQTGDTTVDWNDNGLTKANCDPGGSGCGLMCDSGFSDFFFPTCEAAANDTLRLEPFPGPNSNRERIWAPVDTIFYHQTDGTTHVSTPFRRKITIQDINDGGGNTIAIEVTVKVWWDAAGDSGSVETVTRLFNWLL